MINKQKLIEICNKYNPVQDIENELWPLVQLLNKLNPKFILEIGVEFGGTSKIWHEYCKANNGLLVGVDLNVSHGRDIFNDNNVYFVEGNSNDKDVVDMVYALLFSRGDFFDFVYIDGSHEEEYVYNDIKNYFPMLKPGGLIAFHDYNSTGVKPAIEKTINDSILTYTKEYFFNGKMGTICFKKNYE